MSSLPLPASACTKSARWPAVFPTLAIFAILVVFYSVRVGVAELRGAHWRWIANLSKPQRLPVRILPLLI